MRLSIILIISSKDVYVIDDIMYSTIDLGYVSVDKKTKAFRGCSKVSAGREATMVGARGVIYLEGAFFIGLLTY